LSEVTGKEYLKKITSDFVKKKCFIEENDKKIN